jgi:dienelactone hydrolase
MSKRADVLGFRLSTALFLMCTACNVAAQETVHFDSTDATRLTGVLYRPPGVGPFAAVVLMHGCGGLYNRSGAVASKMKFWAGFLRDQGYVAVLVDSFGPRGLDEICTKKKALNAQQTRSYDAYGALLYLQSLAWVQSDRVALVGWSNGSRGTLSAMAEDSYYRPRTLPKGGFKAAVAFYPQCSIRYGRGDTYKPYAPLLILIGELDDWTPAKACIALVARARSMAAPIDIIVYAGAYHSFDSPNLPLHYRTDVRNRNKPGGCCGVTIGTNLAARDDARRQVVLFLRQHLKDGSAMKETR